MNNYYDSIEPKNYSFARWLRILCLSIAIFAFQAMDVQAQVTVQIGAGTDIPANTLYGPLYRFSSSSTTTGARVNILYTAAEMSAAGIPSGALITGVAFNKTNVANFNTDITSFEMHVANTANTALSTTDTWAGVLSTHTEVVAPAPYNLPLAAGWVSWNFLTPFTYTGGAFEVATGHTKGATASSDAIKWEYTDGLETQIAGVANATGTTLNGTVTGYRERPNIQITYILPVACSGTPTAGITESSANPVCVNDNFTLTLNGAAAEMGLEYQWQSSPDGIAPYVDINLATSSFLNISQTSSTFYQCVITCTNSSMSATSTPLEVVSPPLISGTFTIDQGQATGGANFNSFDDAIAYLACGIGGNVTFNVAPGSGPYTSQVIIPAILGAGPSARVTFNGNGESLNFLSTTTAERHGFRLDAASYITIQDFVINGLATTTSEYAWGIQFTPSSSNNIIENNTINIDMTNTLSVHAGIVASGSNTSAISSGADISNNIIRNNNINGGYYGVIFYGSSSGNGLNNEISDNIIQDFYNQGVYLYYNDGSTVLRNDISRPNRTNPSTFYGVYVSTGSNNIRVDANRIHNPFDGNNTSTSAIYGIFFTSADAGSGTPHIISNNLIYNMNGEGVLYGLYNSGSDNTRFYHNTISLDDQAVSGTNLTRGFYQTTTASGIELFNNIISIGRSGSGAKHLVYFATSSSSITSNNNVLFINAPGGSNNTAYVSGATAPGPDLTTLSELQSKGYDAASVAVDPQYTDPLNGDFLPGSSSVNNVGTGKGVAFDILGNGRDLSFPDPGAYEFTPAGLDASITWVAPLTPVSAGLTDVTVNISNTQTATITSVDITYTDGVITENEVFPLSLSTGNNINLTFATQFNITSTHNLRAYINSVNGGTDNDQVNDTTITVSVCPAMAGNYTIDQNGVTAGTNFASFADAIASMLSCGISASVDFTVVAASGPYAEQVVVPAIAGTSPTVTVTFDGNGEIMNFLSTTSADRSAFRLEGASYTTIKNFVINPQGTYGWGVHLYNGAHHNTIEENEINLPIDLSSSNYIGVVSSGSLTSQTSSGLGNDFNTVQNNIIRGGLHGVSFYGNSTTAQVLSNVITGNTIEDWHTYGIYLYGSDGAVVSGNDLSKPNRTALITTFYGIYLSTGSRGTLVEKNVIHDPFGGDPSATSTCYPFYATGADATSGNENKFINNIFYGLEGGGLCYAFYNSGSDYCQYYHNTVVIDDPGYTGSSSARGWYQTGTAAGLDYKNNLVYITRGGTATNYGYYMGTSASSFTSSNNVLYINSAGTNNIAYISGTSTPGPDLPTLADVQSKGYESGSSDSDPAFNDAANDDYTPTSAAVNDIGANVGVADDLVGNPRILANPDPGALEFTPVAIDLKVTALTAPATLGCYGAAEVISVQIENGGANLMDFASTNATVNITVTGAGSLNVNEVIASGTLASGASMIYNFVATLDMSAFGTYTFNSSVTVVGDGNLANDNLSPAATRENVAPTALPLAVNFDLFDGSNLTAVYPNWYEANGVSNPSGTTSLWLASNATQQTAFGSVSARINLYTTSRNEWIVGPKFSATADSRVEYALAVTNWNSADPDAMGSDDAVRLMISTDCGATWSPELTYNASTGLTNVFQNFSHSLAAYAGQDIQLAFLATDGPVDNAEDYDFHIDNLVVRDVVFDNIGATALISPIAPTSSCFGANETLEIQVTNWGGNDLDFSVNPFTIEWSVTGAIPASGSFNVNTGTLLSNNTTTFVVSSAIDMSAPGTYTFDAYTSAAWDNNGGSTNGGDNSMTQAMLDNVVIASFPHVEDLESATTGNPGTPPAGWSFNSPSAYNWRMNSGTTVSSSTGPTVDHTLGTSAGKYVYTEASSGVTGDTTRFVSPCIDFTSLILPGVDFWYHFYGSDINKMYIDVFAGGVWNNEVDSIVGQVQTSNAAAWAKKRVNLSAYAGQIVKVRFTGIRGGSFNGDMSLDDITFLELPINNIAASALVTPDANSGACLTSTETVTIRVINNGLNTIDFSTNNFDVVWSVTGATTQNGSTAVSAGTLAPNATLDVVVSNSLDMSAAGTYYFDAYTSATWDTDGGLTNGGDNSMATDSASNNAITSLPYLENLETGVSGSPGTPPAGWNFDSPTSFRWQMNTGTTTSSNTGPEVDHTLGTSSGLYVYTEASSGSTGDTTRFISPCVDFTSAIYPGMEFWYHFYGSDIDKMYVDVFSNGSWASIDSIVGTQQSANADAWLKKEVDMTAFAGEVVRVRFTAVKGASFEGDMALDDIRFFEFPTNDLRVSNMAAPASSGTSCYTSLEPLIFTVNNPGANALDFSVNPFTIEWSVSGPNPQTGSFPVNSGTLAAFASMNYQVAVYDMSALGTHTFNAYTSAIWDTDGGLTSGGNNSMSPVALNNVILTPATSLENFETSVSGTPGTPPANWSLSSNSAYSWSFDAGGTITTNTGPTVDHTLGTNAGKYVYTEASSGAAGDTAILYGPCVDLASLTAPGMEFWYHFYGNGIDRMYVDIFANGVWNMNVDSLVGQHQTSNSDPWKKKKVNLVAYSGQIVKARFRAIRGGSDLGDMALDDIEFVELPPLDMGVVSLDSPVPVSCYTVAESISVTVKNNGGATIDFSLNPTDVVLSVSGTVTQNATVTLNTGTLAAGAVMPVAMGIIDMSANGPYAFDVYTSLVGDADNINDTLPTQNYTSNGLAAEIASTTGATRCGPGDVTLMATPAGTATIQWFAAANGGSALASGNNLVVTTANDTTLYAQAVGAASSSIVGGKPAPAATSTASPSNWGLVFDATTSFVLNSVEVYPTSASAGNIVVELQDNTGTMLETATVNVPAGNGTTPFVLPLSFSVPSGNDLRLIAVSGPSMVREFSDPGYPYSLGAAGNITSGYINGTNTTYYYFYNWNMTVGCVSPRQAVTATVTPSTGITASGATTICEGQSTNLMVNSSNGDYTYEWNPGAIAGANPSVSPAVTTVYTVTATDPNDGCTAVDMVTITVDPAPIVNPTASNANICEGTSADLMANASAGNVNSGHAYTGAPVATVDNAIVYADAAVSGYSSLLGSGVSIASVCIDITHTFDGDLDIYLIAPNGIDSLELSTDNGGGSDNYTATCFVTGSPSITTGSAPFTGNYAPEGAAGFAMFDGQDPNGSWTLSVGDDAGGDGGTVNSFEITFTQAVTLSYAWSALPADPSLSGQESLENPSVSPTANTAYSVLVTNSLTGCTQTAGVNVDVFPAPDGTVTPAGPIDICFGQSVTLTAQPGYTYLWSTFETSQSILVDTDGSYSVTVSSPGCNDVQSNVVDVNVNFYSATVNIVETVINTPCPGAASELFADGPVGAPYTWIGPNGFTSSNQTITVTESGTYSVTADSAGCSTFPVAINVTTNQCQVCATPTGLAHTNVGSSSADISWDPAFVGDAFVVRYWDISTGILEYHSVPAGQSATTLHYLDWQSVTYAWQVKTLCASPQPYSSYSLTDTFTTVAGLAAPCDYRPILPTTLGTGPTTADLIWYPVDADAFLLRYEVAGSGTYKYMSVPGGVGNPSSAQITGLFPSTTYNWWVLGICNGVKSRYSVMGMFSTTAGSIPCVKPFDTRGINITTTEATVEWNAVVTADEFRVRYVVDGPAPWNWKYKTVSGIPNVNSIDLTGLLPGTTYRFQILSICSGVKSDYSFAEFFTTTPPPTAPVRAIVDVKGNLSLEAYPNPTSGTVNITLDVIEAGRFQMQLLDLSGRILMRKDGTSSEGLHREELNLSNLNSGLYILDVRMNGKRSFIRLSKE